MSARVGADLPASAHFTEQLRKMTQNYLGRGFTGSRLSYVMQRLGHPWNENIVSAFIRGQRQALTIDEGLALLSAFHLRSNLLQRELDRLNAEVDKLTTEMLEAADRKPGGETA